MSDGTGNEGWNHDVFTVTPGIPGDSGSGYWAPRPSTTAPSSDQAAASHSSLTVHSRSAASGSHAHGRTCW